MSHILVGVTGGIAAYKTVEIVRLLKKSGHDVQVVMTDCAKTFVGKLTFSALSGRCVYDDAMSHAKSPMLHIDLAKWADIVLIAPATAKTLCALAHGDANSLLSTLCLATQAPCYLAPAMNTVMWHHLAVQSNITTLNAYGYHIIPPDVGEQACGDYGIGRMPSPEAIVHSLIKHNNRLANYKILITAGPTFEKIDPIRYLGNLSSGKMGYAMAQAFIKLGANVHLISGPTTLEKPTNCKFTAVLSAQDMLSAVKQNISDCHLFISAAAVANYSMATNTHKIKSTSPRLTLTLERTPDILQLTAQSNPTVFCVGFCAESDNIIEKAKNKLERKGCDAIITNLIHTTGYPFGCDDNQACYINHHDTVTFETMPKIHLAQALADCITDDFLQQAQHNALRQQDKIP